MNRYFIIPYPSSSKLYDQSWFGECIPYEDGGGMKSYLAPEDRIEELFGYWHLFQPHSDKVSPVVERLYYHPAQYQIRFPK